jgi:hypothetical protein
MTPSQQPKDRVGGLGRHHLQRILAGEYRKDSSNYFGCLVPPLVTSESLGLCRHDTHTAITDPHCIAHTSCETNMVSPCNQLTRPQGSQGIHTCHIYWSWNSSCTQRTKTFYKQQIQLLGSRCKMLEQHQTTVSIQLLPLHKQQLAGVKVR